MMLHGALKSLIAYQILCGTYLVCKLLHCWICIVSWLHIGPPNSFLFWGSEISGTGLQVVNLFEKHILCSYGCLQITPEWGGCMLMLYLRILVRS